MDESSHSSSILKLGVSQLNSSLFAFMNMASSNLILYSVLSCKKTHYVIPYLPSPCHCKKKLQKICIFFFQTNIHTVDKLSFGRFYFLYVKVKHANQTLLF